MKRGSCNVSCMTIREYVAVHILIGLTRDVSTMTMKDIEEAPSRAVDLADKLLQSLDAKD